MSAVETTSPTTSSRPKRRRSLEVVAATLVALIAAVVLFGIPGVRPSAMRLRAVERQINECRPGAAHVNWPAGRVESGGASPTLSAEDWSLVQADAVVLTCIR